MVNGSTFPLPSIETPELSISIFDNNHAFVKYNIHLRGLGGVVGLTLPMARADCSSRPVYYLPCSDLGQVVNLSLSVA